jgi:hypothetical protein
MGLVEQFLAADRGVILCGLNGSRIADNSRWADLLLPFGIGLPSCSLKVDVRDKESVKLPRTVYELAEVTFPSLAKRFEWLSGHLEEIQPFEVDSLVTSLRYHIVALRQGPDEVLEFLANAAWQFFDSLANPDTIVSSAVPRQLLNRSVALLIGELMVKLPASYYSNMDRSMPFPGESGELEYADFSLTAEFQTGGWFSTGLYLQAGVVSSVVVDCLMDNCGVQIGSHAANIIYKPGPWKRFPAVTTFFPFNEAEIDVASPFGGIIYITARDIWSPIALNVTINTAARHPLYAISDPSCWEETCKLPVPWAEIETKMVVFTVPTRLFEKGIERNIKQMDELIIAMLTYLADVSLCQYRVVFDVEAEESDDGPIYLPVSQAEAIFGPNQPNMELFNLLKTIATRSIPVVGIPPVARSAIATVAAVAAVERKWPKHRLLQNMVASGGSTAEPLFALHAKQPGTLPEAIQVMRDRQMVDGSAIYRMFLAHLEQSTGVNYSDDFRTSSLSPSPSMGAGVPKIQGSSSKLLAFKVTEDALDPVLPRQ